MLPLLVHIDVSKVEKGNVVGYGAGEANLAFGVEEREAAGIFDDGAHYGIWVRGGPVHCFAGEGSSKCREGDEGSISGDKETIAMPFNHFRRSFEIGRWCGP